jgi:hypothetical protein
MNQAVGAATVGDRFTDHDLSAPHLTREVGGADLARIE